MKTLFFFTPAIALGMAMISGFHASHQNLPDANDNVNQATDGAFRDGLFLGKLAAERGAKSHVAVGRWATVEDRASFTAGYQRGYTQSLASQVEHQ